MSATLVARKDFADAARSRLLWGISALFVLFIGVIVYAAETVGDPPSATATLSILVVPVQLIVPIAALVVGYMAIVGERRSGSIKMLYGLPHRRGDILLGKLLGRSGVMAASVAVGFVAAAALLLVLRGPVDFGSFLGFAAVTALFAMTFVAIAVGISASVSTRGRAMGLALGFYMVFNFFWDAIASGVYYLINGSIPGLEVEAWYFLLKRLSPIQAYKHVASLAFDRDVNGIALFPAEDLSAATGPEDLELANRVIGELPFYLEDWFALVILALWALVPVTIGYLRFRNADLG